VYRKKGKDNHGSRSTGSSEGRDGVEGGVWTTHLFLSVLIRDSATGNAADWTLFAAFIMQSIMTAGESPLWRGKGRWWHIVVLAIDSVTNVGGVFAYITRLDQTDSWGAFNTGLGTSGGLNPLAALILSLVIGVLIAATPEFLWRQD
jgi:hypothetical protein